MFNAVIPLSPPIVAVQVDASVLCGNEGPALLGKLQAFFKIHVALVAWDQELGFQSINCPCEESDLLEEDLVWRAFELPLEPDVPF